MASQAWRLHGWLRKAIRVTNCLKSLGPIEWVVVVGFVVVFVCWCLLVLVLVAFERPRWFHEMCYPEGFAKPSG